MAKARITINDEQAAVIGRLAYGTPSKYPILYDPRAGVNLKKTKAGQYITIKEGKNVNTLKKYQKLGCFSVIYGAILPAPTLSSVTINEEDSEILTLTFSEEVTLPRLGIGDVELKIGEYDDELVLDIGFEIAANAVPNTVFNILLDGADLTGRGISLKITEAGAAKIFNKYNACLVPVTKTVGADPTEVASISIEATKEVSIGTPEDMTITWTPTNSDNKEYTVTSSDELVATVAINLDGTFTITGLLAGTTNITVTPDDGGAPLAEVCTVTVTE